MKKNFFTSLFLFVAISLASIARAEETNATACVQMREQEETALVNKALRDIYPLLPESQKALIDQGLCFVGFYEEPLTHEIAGFGPEDDRFGDRPYKYPDTTLYPQGTIKVNMTLSTLGVIDLAYGVSDALVRWWLMNAVQNFFRHEIKHVEQYIQHPILVLSSPDDCPMGICDAEKMKATKIKLGYELEATRFGNEVMMIGVNQQAWDYIRDWMKNHKEILGSRFEDFANLMSFEDMSQPVAPGIAFFYSAMYQPAVFAKTCAETGKLSADDKRLYREFLKVNELYDNLIERVYPYLTPVFARIASCAM